MEPWEKYADAKSADGPWAKYGATDGAQPVDPLDKYKNMSFWDRVKGDVKHIGEAVTPVARGVVKGINSLPVLAQDLGVGIRNLLPGQNYELPSSMYNKAIDEALPQSSQPGANAIEFGTSLATGLKLPQFKMATNVPAGFVKPSQDLVRQQTLAASQKAGYVVPPSTTNPTVMNKILESIGGKVATAQDAAVKNQSVTNTLSKRALGLTEDAPLTQEAMSALRAEAGDVYGMLRSAGKIVADPQFTDDLSKVTSKFSGASKDFPELAKSEVTDLVAGASKKEFSADSAVDLLSILRDRASKAYASGDKGLGKAYKEVSKAFEDVIERNLKAAGNSYLVSKFKDARQLIAKTHSVESAFNPSTGNVVAPKLATQLSKGKPLSGDLLTVAKFGQAFPKAAQAVTDSGAVRNTDVILGAGASALSREPTYLLYPFARQAARSFLLSKHGQAMAAQKSWGGLPPETVLAALIAEEAARTGSVGK